MENNLGPTARDRRADPHRPWRPRDGVGRIRLAVTMAVGLALGACGGDDTGGGVTATGGSASNGADAVAATGKSSPADGRVASGGGSGGGSIGAAATGNGGAAAASAADARGVDGRPTPLPQSMADVVLDPGTGDRLANPDEVLFDAPVDRGDTDGDTARRAPAADPANKTRGAWSGAQAWPEIPIHASLTPDGRVMSFGTDANGNQGARFNYSVWDPVTGEHLVLPNTTPTDIFCSAQILLPGNGDLLLAGGDIRGRQVPDGAGGIRVNWGVNDVNRYRYQSRTLVRDTPMRFARWYASVLTLPDGRVFTAGGVDENGKGVANPEVYDPGRAAWTPLPGISFYENYPRTFLAPSGRIVTVLQNAVNLIDPNGNGSMTRAATLPSNVNWKLPAVEYDTGKLMVVRAGGATSLIDVNGATPTVTEGAGVGGRREWASLSVLADGQVLMTGGGLDNTGGANVSLGSSIWNPATGRWTDTAAESKSREYHSIAILLPDGRVLSAGGGAPGPVIQLNGEIYTPPYLFDTAGNLAARPEIASAPTTMTPGRNRFSFRMASAEAISKVTMVRAGSVTHAFNFDQSFLTLAHQQQAETVSIDVDRASTVLRPGYYLLFAFNAQGVPSVAKIIRVDPRAADAEQPQPSISATVTNFFGRADLTAVGSAAAYDGSGAVQLAADTTDQIGGVWFRTPVRLDGQTSFSQQVQFRSRRAGDADGMALVLVGGSGTPLGTGGEGLGYGGIANSLAIEIDTYRNAFDPDGNHLGVLTGGNMTAIATAAATSRLAAGTWRTLWVDYDAATRLLSLRVRYLGTDTRPSRAVLEVPVDLQALLGSDRLVLGLTSANGGVANAYQVRKWAFSAGAGAQPRGPVTEIVDDARDDQDSAAEVENGADAAPANAD